MRKASQITHDIVNIVDEINKLEWQLYEAWKKFKTHQKELQHYIKYNGAIKLN